MIEDVIKWVVVGLLGGSVLIEISPIKINPWKWIARSIGKAVNGDVIAEVESLKKDVNALREESDERAAKDCRVRILRFGDEILHDKRHSKEHFDQILQDITDYEQYCESHPNFKNNMTTMTTAHIKSTYGKCLQNHSFLQEGDSTHEW